VNPDGLDRLSKALADRYRIERELGQGGMATVYLAQDLRHDRNVALKVLKPELAAVLGADRFVVEIKTTAALQHPHILPLFDSGSADGFLFYVMPFIEGETLRTKLDRETQLGIAEAVRITSEVADALDYAHRHGVIHRDIKPENILLHDGRPVVADFGIALAVSAAAGGRMTETGLSLGTPHYMSPEQATAEKELTARSDIYSLGCVLYEMLTGNPPHTGATAQQIIMKIVTDEAPPVTKLRKSVPPNVAAATARAIEKLPADRFESAAQLASALANPSYGSDGATAERTRQAARPARSLGPTAAGLVAAALLVGVMGAKLLWRPKVEPVRTSRLMLEFPVDQQPRYSTGGPFPVLAQAFGGSGLLYWGPGATTRAQLMLRSWDRLRATTLPHAVDEGCCVAVSPRGDSLAYLTGPHALHVVPIGGGIPRTVADSGLTSVTDFGGGVDWGADGRLYASSTRGLIRVSPDGGETEMVAALDSTRGDLRFLYPVVLPGARAALITVIPRRAAADPARAAIGLADFTTGKTVILLQGIRAVFASTGHLIVAKTNGSLWAVPFDLKSGRLTGRERELPDTAATDDIQVDLSLSSSGTLAYTKGVVQSFQPVWVERNGESRPVANDLSGILVDDARLSPNGNSLVVTLREDNKDHLWVKPLRGGSKSRLTFDGNANSRPAWRPGTGAISFNSNRERPEGDFELFERNADGSGGIRKLEVGDPRTIGNHTWSPDGKWLVFRTNDQEPGNADIMGIRPGMDTVARPLVATQAEELGPAVSPDGRWLAYSSNESGRREVYVRPFPETANARYQVSVSGGTVPGWSRDGRELFFIDAASKMVAVPILPGPTFQFGAPQVLFSAAPYYLNPFNRQFDVTADKRFLMSRGERDAAVHVVVVFNFLEELKKIMASP
jgi:serine/threonine-protein kinase